jgi:hypothetical protein
LGRSPQRTAGAIHGARRGPQVSAFPSMGTRT